MTSNESPFVLGLDLDGVTAHYTKGMAEVVEDDRGLARGTLPEPTDWNFSNWDLDKSEFIKYHTELVVNRNGFRHLDAFEGTSEVLWRLSDAGVWIRVITHRLIISKQHAVVASDTISWLEEKSIPYRDICFLGQKAEVGADLYVDDGPHNIETLQGDGQNVLVFDQPYNRDCVGPRVRTWNELESFVLNCMEEDYLLPADPL